MNNQYAVVDGVTCGVRTRLKFPAGNDEEMLG